MKFLADMGISPRVVEELRQKGHDAVHLAEQGLHRMVDYEAMAAKIKSALEEKGQVTLAEVRDLFGTTRKYAQALLEHLDAIGATMRDGDFRKLRK